MTIFNKYLYISLVIALANAAILLIFFVPRFIHTDTPQYIATINYVLNNGQGELFLNRLIYPLPMIIGAFLSPIFSPENALIFQNVVFYLLSAVLVFLLVRRLFGNNAQAVYGTLLYIVSYPVLAYGLAPLTDFSGWFFYLLVIWLTLDFVKSPNVKNALLAGFIAGIGMLFKESIVAGGMFFAAVAFICLSVPFREKIKYISIFGMAFLIPVAANSIIMYNLYSYSYLERYIDVWNDKTGSGYAYSLLRIIIEIGRVLAIGWIFVLFGAIREFTFKNSERFKVMAALFFPSISFMFWAFPHNRVIFVAAPLLVLLGSQGITMNIKNEKLNRAVSIALIALYIGVNYFFLEFLLREGPNLQYRF